LYDELGAGLYRYAVMLLADLAAAEEPEGVNQTERLALEDAIRGLPAVARVVGAHRHCS
jgi:hypothetical protein